MNPNGPTSWQEILNLAVAPDKDDTFDDVGEPWLEPLPIGNIYPLFRDLNRLYQVSRLSQPATDQVLARYSALFLSDPDPTFLEKAKLRRAYLQSFLDLHEKRPDLILLTFTQGIYQRFSWWLQDNTSKGIGWFASQVVQDLAFSVILLGIALMGLSYAQCMYINQSECLGWAARTAYKVNLFGSALHLLSVTVSLCNSAVFQKRRKIKNEL